MKRILWATILLLPLGGCVSGTQTSGDALCAGTRQARAAHAAALVLDGGPASLVTGQALIARVDAGCAR